MDAFTAIVRDDAFASQAINNQLKDNEFSQLDKRLVTSIVYRTIENLLAIDHAISFFLKDITTLSPHVQDILRISVCQYLFMDRIPENAISDEAVKVTRSMGFEGLTGLVNAVLRSMMREREKIQWPEDKESADYLSLRYSMPKWLVVKLIEDYGFETARQLIMYRTNEHYMTLRPNLMRLTDEEFEKLLEKKVWNVEKGIVPHAYRVREASQIALDADYIGGNFSIQGESSMLCAQIADVKRGNQVIDCCAAPGGKTAYMAECMSGTGRVFAWDLHEHRVALIKAMQYRLHVENVRPLVRDARILKEDLMYSADVVLLDAPCTGLGVVDDKPDIKYRVKKESIEELVKTQKELLDTCCQYVKKGGALVYSTCSILKEENELQVKQFLETHKDFVLDKMPSSLDERFAQHMGAYGLQLLEPRDGVEGFFIARLKRVNY